MWRRYLLAILLLFNGFPANAEPTKEFAALLDEHWQWRLEADPTFTSMLGDRRYNDRWEDLTIEAIEDRQTSERGFLRRLLSIDSAQLPEDDQLSYDLLRRDLQYRVEAHRFHSYLMPVTQNSGVQTLQNLAEIIPLFKVEDFEDWLERIAAVDTVLAQTIQLLEEGRRSGRVAPAVLMQRVPDQLMLHQVEDARDSPFYSAFVELPPSIEPAEQERLRATAVEVIEDSVVPAYRRFSRYFSNTYLPESRESIGVSALPDGAAYYEHLARYYTTTQMTPDEIHRIGLSEVSRIRAEMEAVIDELEFDGDFAGFLHYLRTDPKFYFGSREELFNAYLVICKQVDPQLVRLFGVLPRMPYGVRPIPDNIAPDTTTAYYTPPAADGSRAGYYYVNLHRPEVRPRYEIEVLSVHEAVPGHHLQLALQMELGDMPEFRRYSFITAFVEGWGLYSESLGYDLGLYRDPYSRFGALTYEMWRAIRLVVDTGMHYKGWTRQQAIDFFRDNAAKTEVDIINEIDRYLSMPGQALAYKIGQLRILELRAKAEQTLGASFDIRRFHDALLGGGSLPLEVLAIRMDRWLARELAGT